MKNLIENRKKMLRRIASIDDRYKKWYAEFLEAEKDYFELLLELTPKQQDRLWRFINLTNDVDERLLEIACEYLVL